MVVENDALNFVVQIRDGTMFGLRGLGLPNIYIYIYIYIFFLI